MWCGCGCLYVRVSRRDGFVAIEAPYIFAKDLSSQPSFTTVQLKVPETCPPPVNTSRPIPPGKKPSPTGCSYEYPGEHRRLPPTAATAVISEHR